MNRQDRIDSIRNWVLYFKECLSLGKEIPAIDMETLSEEFEKLVAFENDAFKLISKQCEDTISNVSKIIDDLV